MSTTTTPTPVILPEDIKFYLSGGYYNSDPSNSLGGEISSFQLPSGALNGLFDRVDTAEAELGDTEYRCIYLRNTSQTRKLLAARIWIETGTASADTAIALSIGSSGINGVEPTVPDEGLNPPMNFFEVPLQEPEEPNIGDLYPGDHIALWIRWYVKTGTQTIGDDFAVIRLDGDREPETLTQPLPDPSDPPTTGCPAGSKWSPTEMRCVDDSTVIICPNAYTYNSTTQRCVPPTTPPPSIPNWTFAAGGDFSCTSDADASGALIGSKLDKTAGDNVGLLLALGDFSYVDGDQSCWYENMESSLGSTIYPANVAPILGNHDDGEDGSNSDRTSVIAEFPLMPSEAYYAFTRKNIRFIMMDTQSSYSSGSLQHTFVVTQLQQAAANPSIKWIIVCYHKPSFTTGSYYGPLTDFRSIYHPLFDQYKVSIIFNGHNHIYFRSKPVKYNSASPGTPTIASDQAAGNYINIDGRVYITSGASGRSSHTEYDSTAENYVGARHAPAPYGNTFVTLQDNGNQLRVQFITNANQVLDDFTLSKPGASAPPTATCPQGFHYDDTLGRCVISPQQCPTNYRWEPTQNRCVSSTGEPGTPPGPVDPLAGVEWYYDSTATQNTPQTINAGSYDSTEGIILVGDMGSVTSMTISGGYINVSSGTGATGSGRIFIDYWKKSRFTADDKPGFNTAFLASFLYEDQISVTFGDGNDRTLGFTPDLTFGYFGTTLIGPTPTEVNGFTNVAGSLVRYYTHVADPNTYHNGENLTSAFPGGRILESGTTYKIFCTIRTHKASNSVILNSWIDFGDGDGWVKTTTDRTWSMSNWNPATVPTGYDDTAQIIAGPSNIKRHHLQIRNNNRGGIALKVKDIKIGTLPYIGDVNNPPPTGGGGTGGGGTGGAGELLYHSNTHGNWNNGTPRTVNDTEGSQAPNGKGLHTAASGDPRLIIDGDGVAHLEADSGHGRIYILAFNYNVQLEYDFKFEDSNVDSHSIKLRSRHQEGGDCANRFGGFGASITRSSCEFQTESCHNNHENSISGSISPALQVGQWYRIRIQCYDNVAKTEVNFKMEINRGSGFQTVLTGKHTNPRDFYMDETSFLEDNSYFWLRINNGSTARMAFRDVTLTKLAPGGSPTGGTSTTPPPTTTTGAYKILSWGDNDTTQNAEDVLNMMMTETNVEQYLFAGDGPYSTDASNWISMMSSYFNTSTLKGKLMLAQGNHEHPESASQTAENQIEAWFPGLHNATNEGLEWLQAKQVRNCYIIVMNSQDPNIATVGGSQYNWVQARLNDAVALRTAGTIDWIIMMVHKSWHNLLGSNPAYVTARQAYKTMIDTAQIDFMFHGHNHSYCIWRPIVSIPGNNENTAATATFTMSGSNYNFALNHGAFYIINGNGGHEINQWGENPADFPNVLYANDNEFGYTVLEIDGKRATIIAKSVGGNVRYTVTAVR